MKGHLLMSVKERQRLLVIERVTRDEMTIDEAARGLGLGYRQVQRLLSRYRTEGDAGLVHRARGQPSSRRKAPDFRASVLKLYKERYPDFGPTLAAETMAERDKLFVNPETLRLWLIQESLWQTRKQRLKHRSWRQRKSCFGELVQFDGSVHDWFEGRSSRCFLMSMVDDATGTTLLHFAPEETTLAAMQVLEAWIHQYGIPAALYSDQKMVYLTQRKPTLTEELQGAQPKTQFGRACEQLGIALTYAHSPQAKGRVERKHGVCQDRLVKALRLQGIGDLDAANAFLPEWLTRFNTQFVKAAHSPTDLHRPLPQELCLKGIFCRHEERTIQNDWTVRYYNRWLQILSDRAHPLPKTGNRVVVEARRDGALYLRYKDQPLAFRELEHRPTRHPAIKARAAPAPKRPPRADHPWRGKRSNAAEPWVQREMLNLTAFTYLPPTGIEEMDRIIASEVAPDLLQPMRHFQIGIGTTLSLW